MGVNTKEKLKVTTTWMSGGGLKIYFPEINGMTTKGMGTGYPDRKDAVKWGKDVVAMIESEQITLMDFVDNNRKFKSAVLVNLKKLPRDVWVPVGDDGSFVMNEYDTDPKSMISVFLTEEDGADFLALANKNHAPTEFTMKSFSPKTILREFPRSVLAIDDDAGNEQAFALNP